MGRARSRELSRFCRVALGRGRLAQRPESISATRFSTLKTAPKAKKYMIEPPEDHFSKIAPQYARGRFGYPGELFDFLLAHCSERKLAWDCATGSGQAAEDLACRFSHVIATDISAELLALAPSHPRITFRVAPAENSGIDADSVDLITAAQAVHWFDLPRFWAEALRVLRDEGVVAVWGYTWPLVSAKVDHVLEDLKGILVPFWPERSAILHAGYRDLSPPLREIVCPKFEASARWDLNGYLSHMESWSAIRYHREVTNENLLGRFRSEFAKAWAERTMVVRWPLVIRVFQKG